VVLFSFVEIPLRDDIIPLPGFKKYINWRINGKSGIPEKPAGHTS
jgi:hypothetical protein